VQKQTHPLVTLAVLALAGWLILGDGQGCSLPIPGVLPGPRLVVIVRESESDSPAFARMVTNLRNGEAATALETGKHQLDVLDDDSPTAAKWLPALQGLQQPAVMVVAPPDKVLAKQSLPADATAATVLSLLKANGG
jgi:hypothetical protein